jgi:hypothetical protein
MVSFSALSRERISRVPVAETGTIESHWASNSTPRTALRVSGSNVTVTAERRGARPLPDNPPSQTGRGPQLGGRAASANSPTEFSVAMLGWPHESSQKLRVDN